MIKISKDSNNLNLSFKVFKSSNDYVITDANLFSNSFNLSQNFKKSFSNYFSLVSIKSYYGLLNIFYAKINSLYILFILSVKCLPLVPPNLQSSK